MKLHHIRTIGLWGLWLAMASLTPNPAAAQQSAPPVPVLRSVTRLVQVNVIALDKKGNPVSDLKASDFSLTDDGKPQEISVFRLRKATRRHRHIPCHRTRFPIAGSNAQARPPP